ncbi:MAG: hypothetical protein O2800_07890 [Planctomycetota bacterium]|nr:hypothetical protein [Planctomycetota bacterium]
MPLLTTLLVATLSQATPPQIEIDLVGVGDPGNEALPIINFNPTFPTAANATEFVGAVSYDYEIGRFEVTVNQWVSFLNTVDPSGANVRGLWDVAMSPDTDPKYGSVRQVLSAPVGARYQLASPVWSQRPIAWIDFFRAARFINALYNGHHERTVDGNGVARYRCWLSQNTETGAYDLRNQATFGAYATRGVRSGFVLPSQDEWIKAAYFSHVPTPSGSHYWRYPTQSDEPPTSATVDACGEVTNAGIGPLANFNNIAEWCPASCPDGDVTTCPDPFGFLANLTRVGACHSPSPWNTLDQGGNLVEWTDTVVAPVAGAPNPLNQPIWRQVHGGIATAPAYQLWMSATGATDPYGQFLDNTRAFAGFRVGFLPSGATGCAADLTGDGVVNGQDLGILTSEWGPCQP